MVEAGEAGPSSSSGRERGRVAYLGPEGTYGQQATRAFISYLEQELESIACPTISDAYEESSEYTVLPLENTIYGPVTETLDCFFSRFNPSPSSNSNSRSGVNLEGLSEIQKSIKGKGKEKEIIATLDLPIRHCLVVKRGTRIEDITIVSSHEQALGQSATFLNAHLPNAKRISTASTALAAESLLEQGKGGRAAICSKSVIGIYPELEVLVEGTQDRSDNFTRFILLRSAPSLRSQQGGKGAISNFYLLNNPSLIPSLLPNSNANSTSIGSLHSRPIPIVGRTYPHGIFIELISQDNTSLKEGKGQVENGVIYLGSGSNVQLETA